MDTNKKHSLNDIRKHIKNIDQKNFKNLFPTYEGCGCGQCPINPNYLLNFIKENLIVQSLKPDCGFYYEFYQNPVYVKSISLEN
jgi:hypothetical protein